MRAGDSLLSPAGSGGEVRNDGSEEVRLLASLLIPLPAGTGPGWHPGPGGDADPVADTAPLDTPDAVLGPVGRPNGARRQK